MVKGKEISSGSAGFVGKAALGGEQKPRPRVRKEEVSSRSVVVVGGPVLAQPRNA